MYRRFTAEMSAIKSPSKLKCILFLGSTREGRFGLRVAKFVQKQLELSNYLVELFDPVVLKFPLLEMPVYHYPDRSLAPKWMVECEEKIKSADAFVVVSTEYNHSIPPALSNMLDHFPAAAFSYKPTGIVTYSYGRYGGMRAAMQLRAFLSELGTLSVPFIFAVPEVLTALDENGKPLNDHMEKGAKEMIQQLDWYANAMKNHRQICGVPK